MVAAGLVVGGGAVVAAPLVLSAAGFTAGGVAAGSAAAFVQSMIGNVAAGSWFALCQSAGAAGIATSSSAVIGTVGTAVGSAAAGLSGLFKGKKKQAPADDVDQCQEQKTSLQKVGAVCAVTLSLTLLCVVAAIFVSSWSRGLPHQPRRTLPGIEHHGDGGDILKRAARDVREALPRIHARVEDHVKSISGSQVAKSVANTSWNRHHWTLLIFSIQILLLKKHAFGLIL